MRKTSQVLSIVKNSGNVLAPLRRHPGDHPELVSLPNVLVLDRFGYIRSYGHDIATLVGVTTQDLIGQPVKSLLPTIPLHGDTPGYNIAFTVFQASAERHLVFHMKKGSSAMVTVAVSFTVPQTVPEYLIALKILDHASLSAVALDPLASERQPAFFCRCA